MLKTAPSVGFISLGCPKATVDSEEILTALSKEGYRNSSAYDEADVVIVNTCGFIDDAVTESLDVIAEALHENGKVIVTGCLGSRKDSQGNNYVTSIHPSVLGVTGPNQTDAVLNLMHHYFPVQPVASPMLPPYLQRRSQRIKNKPLQKESVHLTPKHYAYLKISEGCNHHCTFCIIPDLRGTLVSRSLGDILSHAQVLLDSGVKELLVVSQDTSAYGVDKKYATEFIKGHPMKANFYGLVKALGRLAEPYGAWVRLHYIYPYPNVDSVIPLMADGLVLSYLDLPMQHAHPAVLKRMRRPANNEKALTRIQAWRQQCPQLTLRSTFIAGFPGETEEEFETLLNFLTEAKIDRLGCFAYSPIEGAKANQLPGAIPEEERYARRDAVLATQQAISLEALAQKVGTQQQVLVDALVAVQDLPEEMLAGFEITDTGNPLALCRSSADAPEIDGNVIVMLDSATKQNINVGDFVKVDIYAANNYDLLAKY